MASFGEFRDAISADYNSSQSQNDSANIPERNNTVVTVVRPHYRSIRVDVGMRL